MSPSRVANGAGVAPGTVIEGGGDTAVTATFGGGGAGLRECEDSRVPPGDVTGRATPA